MDYIVTWNFSHINNPYTISMIRRTVEEHGYVCPEIVSTWQMLTNGTISAASMSGLTRPTIAGTAKEEGPPHIQCLCGVPSEHTRV